MAGRPTGMHAQPPLSTARSVASALEHAEVTVMHPESLAAAALAQALRARGWVRAVRHRRTLDLATAAGAARGPVIVRVCVLDRLTGTWPGERYLRRLAAQGGPSEVIAWVDADDRDALAVAAAIGVPVLRTAVTEQLDLTAALDEQPVVATATETELAAFAAWFEGAYPNARWSANVEHVLGALVSGGAAKERAEWLGLAIDSESLRVTTEWLRTVSEWLVGEVRDDDHAVRAEAMVVLRQLARVRPLAAEVVHSRSVARAVALLDAHPDVADVAGLEDGTVALLRAVGSHLPQDERGTAGRRRAGAWRRDRLIALTRLAYSQADCGRARAALRDAYERRLSEGLDDVYAAARSHARPAAAA